jgi:hypothetical protein
MARAKASGGPSPTLAMLAMLVASTVMALAQQYLIKLRAAHKSTLSVSFTMYTADVLLAAITGGLTAGGKIAPRRVSPRLRLLTAAVPALDVAGCLLAHFGLDRLGAGPFTLYFSSILALSAIISRVALSKRLSAAQLSGIALVTVGLLARSLLSDAGAASDDAIGVCLTLLSTAAYALRTVSMEAAKAAPGGPTGAELSGAIGRWGFATLSLWQLCFTLPRWIELVARPTREAGVTLARAAVHHGAYVAARMAFVLSQNLVIAAAGATGVALVTAVRSVAVGLASAALFCGTTPSQCLTLTQGACAGLVVAGGVTYALAAPPAGAGAQATREKET